MDEDVANLKNKTGSISSAAGSMGSRNYRLLKAQTTKNNIQTINNADQMDHNNKTLYTNISLREISQSPDGTRKDKNALFN